MNHPDPATTLAPAAIGPYLVTGLLGAGGMGTVYRAHRPDLGRSAAVKLLPAAWLTPDRRERFEAEPRLLARLDHPSIARLYDTGTLADGTPWFAMELCEGEPLSTWLARHPRPLQERLGLFRSACEAVAFAQSRAVIHLDLKPSNFLVDGEGRLKLLDFGISRHLGPDAAGDGQTRTDLRPMTLAYAAPEQVRGEPSGLHTDVWALGVILFELLTGERPFDHSAQSDAEVERAILHESPERPSTVARRSGGGGVTVGRSGWQDLDVLCMTALQKDPGRRYASADALLRDVEGLLAGRPLEARADSATYRLRKLLAAHRWLVGGSAVTAAVVALSALHYVDRLARTRDGALAEAARAQRVQTFLQNLLRGGNRGPGPDGDLRVQALLDRAVEEADQLDAEPETQADVLATLGVSYARLWQPARASPLLERALERHRVLRGPEDPAAIADLAALARLRLDQARLDEAERLSREAAESARRALPRDHPAGAEALLTLGTVLTELGRLEEATSVLEEAVALCSQPRSPRLALADAVARLGDVHYAAGRYEQAEPLNERAAAIYQAELGPRHPRVAERLFFRATIRAFSGRAVEADTDLAREGLEMLRAWHGAVHPRTAAAMNDLGVWLAGLKRLDEAEPLLREALAIEERVQGPNHPAVASTLHALGMLTIYRGRYAEAAGLCRRSAAVFRTVHGDRHPLYASGLICEALAHLRAREAVPAELLARQALGVFLATLPRFHRDVAITEGRLGSALLLQGRFAEAEPHTRAALEFLVSRHGPEFDQSIEQRDHLEAIYAGLGEAPEAARLRAEREWRQASAARPTAEVTPAGSIAKGNAAAR